MVAQISGDSAQAVAYALLERIAVAEDWAGNGGSSPDYQWRKHREDILAAYRECLVAVLVGRAPPAGE
jgi:hypothetical protein